MIRAIQCGHEGVLRERSRLGVDLNLAHADAAGAGTTPLMYAAVKGRATMVNVLLESGANKALVNAEGKSARDMATKAEIAELL